MAALTFTDTPRSPLSKMSPETFVPFEAFEALANPSLKRCRLLLTTLVLLGSRLVPELEGPRDALILALPPRQRIVTLLAAAILEDSHLFSQIPGEALFAGVTEGRWINIRKSTFEDKHRMLLILKAVDPQGAFWSDIVDCSEASWIESGDCEALVRQVLRELNIEFNLSTHFIDIDAAQLVESLAQCALLAAAPLEQTQVDKLYETLFTESTLNAVRQALRVMAEQGGPQCNDSLIQNQDLMAGVKLLLMSVSVFLGAGLVIGHTMTGRVMA